jgi:hypothetical protein
MVAYRGDGVVGETTNWQRFGNGVLEGTMLMEDSRNMLFIADIPTERASRSLWGWMENT